jgi:hypothetical protein
MADVDMGADGESSYQVVLELTAARTDGALYSCVAVVLTPRLNSPIPR